MMSAFFAKYLDIIFEAKGSHFRVIIIEMSRFDLHLRKNFFEPLFGGQGCGGGGLARVLE